LRLPAAAAVILAAALLIFTTGLFRSDADPLGADTLGADVALDLDEGAREADEPVHVDAKPEEVAEPDPLEGLHLRRVEDPARTVVEDDAGTWVATFTDGARTVALAGPERRFDEPTATHGVTSTTWVRLLAEPFDGEVDGDWLSAARDDASDDLLATAMQYLSGSPDVYDDDGVLLAADASYGPLMPDGTRPVGSDWHDFQGVTATYGDIVDRPDPAEFRSLDCSGYVRILFGVRFGVPMTLRPDGGTSLPRRSFEQAAEAPGVVPIPNTGKRARAHDRLQPGDLVFFDAPSDNDGRIDHVGIYLGLDDAGHHRFVHSRRSSNGPTLGGDAAGPSILDGDGFFARGFRSSRRI
jgi:cell wall-associated NlpC family hydrolase